MQKVRIQHIDAFSHIPGKGNPAGVVLNGEDYNESHARHFSSPISGTIEDAVTGTASGVMGAYYNKYVNENLVLPETVIVEQGHEMNKDGKVFVHLQGKEHLNVSILGTAVYVKEIHIEIDN